jgi:cobalt-zinc-cadmium efflux system outer membrane protein
MLRRDTLLLFSVLLLTNAVYAPHAWSSEGHGKATLGSEYKTFQPSSQPSGNAPSPINPSGVITLQQALSLGLMQNPELGSFSWEMRSAEARTLQAGLLPNPEISAEVENFGGPRELKGFNGSENTIQINQLFELGGKRSKRQKLAALEKDLSGWDFEAKRLDVYTDITKAFWDVLAAQERLAITRDLLQLSEQVYTTVVERVKAGKVAPLEEIQANVSLTTMRIELAQTEREMETARKQLAATWGGSSPAFEKVSGAFDVLEPIPEQEQIQLLISQNPDIARWDTEIAKARAAIKLKDADAIPDVTLGAGPRYFNETNDNALVMGISMPIPLFNRNQGERLEARHNLSKAEEQRKAAQIKALTDLAQAYQELSSAYLSAAALKENALPGAQSAFNAAQEGYREGKFSYLQVIDAQRTFFEVKRQYVAALADYHKSRAGIERLIAQPVSETITKGKKGS